MTQSFQPASSHVRRRLIATITGMEKSGKTHQGLTAPGPVFFHNFDVGDEGVVEKFLTTKKVMQAEYVYNTKNGADHALTIWLQFKDDFKYALKAAGDGTVLVDTGTEMYELVRLARFGKLTQVNPYHYGPVYAELRELIRDAYESSANVIFTHQMRSVYENDKRTEKYEMAGYNGMPYLVQANLRVWYDTDGTWHLYVVNCRQNMTLAGADLTGGLANFSELLNLVFP